MEVMSSNFWAFRQTLIRSVEGGFSEKWSISQPGSLPVDLVVLLPEGDAHGAAADFAVIVHGTWHLGDVGRVDLKGLKAGWAGDFHQEGDWRRGEISGR